MKSPNKIPDIASILTELGRNGQAAHAIWVATRLDRALSKILSLYMPNLSNTLRDILFQGYGPLSSFSAKIDVSYALELIPSSLRRDLHVIRKIRNKFAHSTDQIHFDNDEMLNILIKFSDYNPKMDRLAFFGQKYESCLSSITNQTLVLVQLKSLKDAFPTNAEASRE